MVKTSHRPDGKLARRASQNAKQSATQSSNAQELNGMKVDGITQNATC
jgi:hypothetical protein